MVVQDKKECVEDGSENLFLPACSWSKYALNFQCLGVGNLTSATLLPPILKHTHITLLHVAKSVKNIFYRTLSSVAFHLHIWLWRLPVSSNFLELGIVQLFWRTHYTTRKYSQSALSKCLAKHRYVIRYLLPVCNTSNTRFFSAPNRSKVKVD